MSLLRVCLLCSLLAVVYSKQDACPQEDHPLCHVINTSIKSECYFLSTLKNCCKTCRSLAATDMPSTCLYGDQTKGVVANGKFYQCDLVTEDMCKYCSPPYHARENCCESCTKFCDPKTQGQTKRISNLLRALRDMIEK